MDPGGIHLDAKLPEDENSKSIAKNGERNDSEDKNCASPIRAQQKVAGDETCDKKHETRMNAAALGRDLHRETRQMKLHSLFENRHAEQFEETAGSAGGTVLKKTFDRVFDLHGKRNYEDEKCE